MNSLQIIIVQMMSVFIYINIINTGISQKALIKCYIRGEVTKNPPSICSCVIPCSSHWKPSVNVWVFLPLTSSNLSKMYQIVRRPLGCLLHCWQESVDSVIKVGCRIRRKRSNHLIGLVNWILQKRHFACLLAQIMYSEPVQICEKMPSVLPICPYFLWWKVCFLKVLPWLFSVLWWCPLSIEFAI